MPDYDVVWDGSTARNRGYLNAYPEPTRQPAPREDCRHLNGPLETHVSMTVRVEALLRTRMWTASQLEHQLKAQQSAVAGALSRLRDRGVLRSRKERAVSGRRKFVNYHWIDA